MTTSAHVLRPMSERQLQRAIMDACSYLGWQAYSVPDSRRATSNGFPDLVLCNKQALIFAELKSARGRLRPEQKVWIEALRNAGQDVRLWRPSDWDEIIATLGGKVQRH